MVPSKTYLKFKETRSQEDLNTLNKYLKRLSEISSKLNNDALELSDEEENKLYDEDEDLTDKVMGGNILIMGASSHPTSEEPLTYENTHCLILMIC